MWFGAIAGHWWRLCVMSFLSCSLAVYIASSNVFSGLLLSSMKIQPIFSHFGSSFVICSFIHPQHIIHIDESFTTALQNRISCLRFFCVLEKSVFDISCALSFDMVSAVSISAAQIIIAELILDSLGKTLIPVDTN